MKYMHIQKCTYLPYWTVNTLIHCGTGITFFVSKFISTNVSVVCNHWTSDANCKDSILKIFPLYDYAGDTASHHLSPFCQVSLKFSLSGLFCIIEFLTSLVSLGHSGLEILYFEKEECIKCCNFFGSSLLVFKQFILI